MHVFGHPFSAFYLSSSDQDFFPPTPGMMFPMRKHLNSPLCSVFVSIPSHSHLAASAPLQIHQGQFLAPQVLMLWYVAVVDFQILRLLPLMVNIFTRQINQFLCELKVGNNKKDRYDGYEQL